MLLAVLAPSLAHFVARHFPWRDAAYCISSSYYGKLGVNTPARSLAKWLIMFTCALILLAAVYRVLKTGFCAPFFGNTCATYGLVYILRFQAQNVAVGFDNLSNALDSVDTFNLATVYGMLFCHVAVLGLLTWYVSCYTTPLCHHHSASSLLHTAL